MTDTLILEDPNDTGEIPAVDPGPDTRATLDGELAPSLPGPPPPLPPTPPAPRIEGREPKSWLARMLYRGEHRAVGR